MTFTLESRVVERVPAWVPCDEAYCHEEINESGPLCPTCNGKQGSWNENIDTCNKIHFYPAYDITTEHGHLNGNLVTKSSILQREHGVCTKCDGKKVTGRVLAVDWLNTIGDMGPRRQMDALIKEMPNEEPCPRCLKDADGKPSGAEPGTAGPWGVSE